jgi:hypothetical protein
MLEGQAYYIFLLFAVVGLMEMGFVIYRIVSESDRKQRLDRLQEHLEEGRDEDEVSESFYREHASILEGDSN